MDWLVVKTTDDVQQVISANSIMSFYYNKDSDLTIIDFIRSAWPSMYVHGNVVPDIKKLLSAHGSFVSQIGV